MKHKFRLSLYIHVDLYVILQMVLSTI
uniref:Uncharacterized protein n=1 Tax=Anguilla anguilla TaxID=7936 RepID=A0A0E9RWX9_ANGAN